MSDRKKRAAQVTTTENTHNVTLEQAKNALPINRRELFCRFLVTVTAIVGLESLAVAKPTTTRFDPLHDDHPHHDYRAHGDKPHQDGSVHTDNTNHSDQNPHTDVGSGALHVDTNHVDIPTPVGHSDTHSDHTDGHTDIRKHSDSGHADGNPHYGYYSGTFSISLTAA